MPPRALWSCAHTCTQLQKPRGVAPTSPAAHMRLCSLLLAHDPVCLQADVFSFGIMMYEVLQRYIMLSAVAVRGTYEELEAYCARVADGYRPPLHTKWPPSMAKLIQVRQEGQRLLCCHGVHACMQALAWLHAGAAAASQFVIALVLIPTWQAFTLSNASMRAPAACRIAGLRSPRIDQQWMRSGLTCALNSMFATATYLIDAEVLLSVLHVAAWLVCNSPTGAHKLPTRCAGGDALGEHPDVGGDGGAG